MAGGLSGFFFLLRRMDAMWNEETQRTKCNKCFRDEKMRFGGYWKSENHYSVSYGVDICKWCVEMYLIESLPTLKNWLQKENVSNQPPTPTVLLSSEASGS